MALSIEAFNGDISVDSRGDLAMVSGLSEVIQRVHQRLRFWRGEDLLDGAIGMNWKQLIRLYGRSDGAIVGAAIRSAVLSVSDVTECEVLSMDVSSERRLTVRLSVLTAFGGSDVEVDV